MEELQGPISPFLVGEDLDVGWLEEFVSNYGSSYKLEDAYYEGVSQQSSEGKMPFLQMLETVETLVPTSVTPATTFPLIHEPNYFQLLLRLQHEKMLMSENPDFSCNLASPSELDSCVTNIINQQHHSVKEEPAQLSPKKCTDEHQKAKSVSKRANVIPKEKRKRKKPSKPTKNTEEAETQRMIHIAVERNRRKLMNEHLNTLRSLMPSSYVQRGDQASIIGGAIDYVKEMEQLLQSLEAEKAIRQHQSEDKNTTYNNIVIPTVSSTPSSSNMINTNMFATSSTYEFRNNLDYIEEGNTNNNGYLTQIRRSNNGDSAENRSDFAQIKVVVIQNHVNLKIQCQRRFGHLLKAILIFQELRLTILHLNITSLHTLAHYSFNLKIEDDCGLRTADDVVRAVHHIFN